jgi:MFS family permease
MATRTSLGLIRQEPAFRALWAARSVSFVGSSLSQVALILYVADRVGTGAAVALLMIVGTLLPTLASPVAGALVDRLPPRPLLLGCELGQAGVLALVAVLLPGLPLLLTLIAAKTVFAVVFDPASRAVVPRLVGDADLEVAGAALGIGTYGLDVAGPLIAAGLLPVLAVRGVLWVDVASFVASALLLATLPALGRAPRPDGGAAGGIWAETRAGLRYLAGHPTIRVLAFGFWAVVLCTGLDDVTLVFLAKRSLHAGDGAVAVLYAGVGLGLLLGFLLLSRRREVGGQVGGGSARPLVLVLAGFTVSSAGNLFTGLAWAVTVAGGLQVVRGLGLAAIETGLPAVVARSVPGHLHGRTFAVVYGGVGLAAVLSYVAGGAALAVASPRTVLVVAGALGVLASAATAAKAARNLSTLGNLPANPAP